MNLSSLALLLDRIATPASLPPLKATNATSIVSHPRAYPDPFVTPTVALAVESGNAAAPVLLVSASAAVGKSYLAKYIAATTGNPLWDLSASDTRMGSHFFYGTLNDAYADVDLINMKERIRSRGVSIVVDALDEALVHVGMDSYVQAIANLAVLAAESRPGSAASFVLLGRTESLDYVAVALSERGVDWQRMQIEFFSRTERRDFVHIIAESVEPKSASRQQIDQFIDVVFGVVEEGIRESGVQIAGAPADDTDLDSFLGYAPVLDALARLASQQDGDAAVFSAGPDRRDLIVWKLLAEVMQTILNREIDKVCHPESAERHIYDEAFSPSRQIAMFFGDLTHMDVALPPGLSAEVADRINKRIESQFRDHPFSRTGFIQEPNPLLRFKNPAFRDYAICCVMAGGSTSPSYDLTGTALTLLQYEYTPSPLFIRLLVTMAGTDPVPMTSLGYMLDSAATRLGTRLLETSVKSVSESASNVSLEFSVLEDGVPIGSCRIVGGRGDLKLNRQLAHCEMYLGSLPLEIASSYEFALGPDVFVECGSLASATYSVRVEPATTGPDDVAVSSGSVIKAGRLTGATRSITGAVNDLEVQVLEDPIFPWSAFRVDWPGGKWSYSSLYAAAMGLRRLCSWFLRRSMDGGQRYPVGALDTILAKGRAPQDWFDFLSSKGYLVKRRYVYELNLGTVSLLAVQQVDLSDRPLAALAEQFLETQAR